MLREIAREELHKDAMCSFEQILEAAHNKTAAVRPLSSHLTNHTIKIAGLCWRSKDEFVSNILQWTPMQVHTSVHQTVKTYIHQLCAITRSCLEDWSRIMIDRGKWCERVKRIHAVGMP